MNDDAKAAVDELRDAVKLDRQRCGDDMAESLWKNELLILAHIDGEPARIAAACEEVREACANAAAEADCDCSEFEKHCQTKGREALHDGSAAGVMADIIRATPLTATPLADEIAALRARVAELERQREGMLMGGVTTEARAQLERAEKAEAERDSLRARRCDAYSLLRPEFDGVTFCRKDGARAAQDVLDERDALRAKVFEVEQRQVGYVLVSFASHEQWKAELAELGALRARLDALYGVILFAHAFAEAEPLVSGYVRLHGHILHLREIHALARVAADVLAAMDEAKP